jgi:hypothetical protein
MDLANDWWVQSTPLPSSWVEQHHISRIPTDMNNPNCRVRLGIDVPNRVLINVVSLAVICAIQQWKTNGNWCTLDFSGNLKTCSITILL